MGWKGMWSTCEGCFHSTRECMNTLSLTSPHHMSITWTRLLAPWGHTLPPLSYLHFGAQNIHFFGSHSSSFLPLLLLRRYGLFGNNMTKRKSSHFSSSFCVLHITWQTHNGSSGEEVWEVSREHSGDFRAKFGHKSELFQGKVWERKEQLSIE